MRGVGSRSHNFMGETDIYRFMGETDIYRLPPQARGLSLKEARRVAKATGRRELPAQG